MEINEYNYMKALWAQFCTYSVSIDGLLPEDCDSKKCRLTIRDAIDEKCEEVSLNSFIAGFKLAAGIDREIYPGTFSFEDEEERRARQLEDQ